jgi:KAP-like P-loop domain-containing protein
LLFPNEFERVASPTRKREIVRAFSDRSDRNEWVRSASLVEIDRELLAIRRRLEKVYPGQEIDFYSTDLRPKWDNEQNRIVLQRTSRPKVPESEQSTGEVGPQSANGQARAGVALAHQFARAAGLQQPTPDLLFAAYLALVDHRQYSSPAATHLHYRMKEAAAKRRMYISPGNSLLGRYKIELFERIDKLPDVLPGPALAPILGMAEMVQSRVAYDNAQDLSPRHILAVLLLPGLYSASPVLEELGFDPADLRSALLASVESRRLPEDLDVWRRILLEVNEAPAPEVTVYAGFSTDALRSDETAAITRGDDRLGVMRDVTALSEVLAARETRPPLAVGLFGDWGTGKSFFMELMRQEIDALGRQNPSFYCRRVVQVWFNAWHYMESNLWASLAARVFEELSQHLRRWEFPEDQRRRLFDELQASEGMLAEAVHEREAADARLQAVCAELAASEQSLAQAARNAFGAAADALREDTAVQSRVREVGSQLGLDDAQTAVERAAEQGREILSLGQRVAAIFRELRGRPVLLGGGIAVFALVTGVAWWALRRQWNWGIVPGAVAALASGLTAARLAIAPAVANVREMVGWLEDVAARLRDRAEAQRREKELAAQRELMRLEQREREARARVEALTREIDDLRAGRRLQRFIVERHASAEYRQHLGLVNLIRNDFERLSTLLSEAQRDAPPAVEGEGAAADAQPLPRIDRIILYIDDLDRCPEDRVVQVLQAVHLLLAFPLFVVVVGVDSRWLLLSLEDHYAALRGRPADGDGERRKSEPEWSTTPQNYLEKIFQIPFTLRPMESDGFGSLVESLLPISEPDETPVGVASSPAPETRDEPVRTPDADRTSASDEGGETDEDGDDGDEEDVEIEETEDETVPPAPVPPNPQGLTVEKRERELIRRLHPLISSPRALKRFTNVYRFLRVQQRGPALDRFRGTDTTPGEYEVVALLLAAIVGYPAEAARLLRSVLLDPAQEWWQRVEQLDDAGADEDTAVRAEASGDGPAPAGERGRTSLRTALLKIRGASVVADHPPEAYVRWTREVARFSFQSGRILSVREPEDAGGAEAAA